MDAVLDRPTTRRIPARKDICDRCGRAIVWARTVAGPNGPGGKAQPFEPYEDEAGRVALYPGHRGQLFARALFKDEGADHPVEYLGMPHVATCPGAPDQRPPQLPPDVADLRAAHAARARRRGSRR